MKFFIQRLEMSTRHSFTGLAITLISLFILIGCGGTVSPTQPSDLQSSVKDSLLSSSRQNLGLWQFQIDPENESIDLTQLRTAETHMNGIPFMEPPAGVSLAIDQVVSFSAGEITIDLRITHPYAALDKTAAFDVCGILISHGSMDFPIFDQFKWPGEDVVHLKNPDGYTRWWNPHEFPYNADSPINGYVDGLLGTPHDVGQFTATLNGYKYFSTDLTDPEAGLEALDTERRGVLEPGTSAIRRYVIGFTPGELVFNYAVDANWYPPTPSGPSGEVIIPDDFPPSANRTEPYRVEVQNVNNGLFYDSGGGYVDGLLTMSVYIYDWFEPESNMICPYAQYDEVMGFCNPTPTEVGDGWAAYSLECMPYMADGPGEFMLWLSVETQEIGYQEHIPFETNSVYFQTWFDIVEQ